MLIQGKEVIGYCYIPPKNALGAKNPYCYWKGESEGVFGERLLKVELTGTGLQGTNLFGEDAYILVFN